MFSLTPIDPDSIWVFLSSRYVLCFYAPLPCFALGSRDEIWIDAPSLVRADPLRDSLPLPWSGRQHRGVCDASNPPEVLWSCWRFKDVFLDFQSVPRLLSTQAAAATRTTVVASAALHRGRYPKLTTNISWFPWLLIWIVVISRVSFRSRLLEFILEIIIGCLCVFVCGL